MNDPEDVVNDENDGSQDVKNATSPEESKKVNKDRIRTKFKNLIDSLTKPEAGKSKV